MDETEGHGTSSINSSAERIFPDDGEHGDDACVIPFRLFALAERASERLKCRLGSAHSDSDPIPSQHVLREMQMAASM